MPQGLRSEPEHWALHLLRRFTRNDGLAELIEEGVEISGEFEHAGFGQWTAFAHDFPALGGHQIVVRPGSVLVTAGGE